MITSNTVVITICIEHSKTIAGELSVGHDDVLEYLGLRFTAIWQCLTLPTNLQQKMCMSSSRNLTAAFWTGKARGDTPARNKKEPEMTKTEQLKQRSLR